MLVNAMEGLVNAMEGRLTDVVKFYGRRADRCW